MPVLVDTSALYALADANDVSHHEVLRYVTRVDDTLIAPVTVLSELDYLLTSRLGVGARVDVLRSIASNEFRLENLEPSDLRRAADIVERYADSDIGFVDASIVAISERLRIGRILTLDLRHFGLIRPKHLPAFQLIP